MDYTKLHWQSDWMYSELMGIDYDDIADDDNFAVGLYSLRDFPEINMYINTETGKIMEIWIESDE